MLGRLVLLALVALPAAAAPTAVATFAGGCFWCMEPPFDALDGVLETTVGYTGGEQPDPSYEQVSSGKTGHVEAVRIVYDPARIDYRRLLEVFWRNIDPTRDDGQFCDRGSSYRAMIFYHDARQKALAEESRAALAASGRFERVVTPIRPAGPFYPAEERHQDYYRKNPLRYAFYRKTCGRDRFLREHWGEAAH
ncbi:MAG: peptide methionine sulfoxide reductase MsrA [Gammaproteobacteria bacterium]|nr:MAG: peptide methionine sulfoxide reductase MsrA [Gammaproteobacteria bacterium]